jgi:hypothetical protein
MLHDLGNVGAIKQLMGLSGLSDGKQNPWSQMHGMESMEALPIITSVKAGQARLRVTTNPVYDSELTGTSALTSIDFFRAPNGGFFQYATTTKKTLSDSNLYQAGQLGSPYLFDLTAFNLKVTPNTTTPVTEADLLRMYVNSYFQFSFNNRPFLQIPTWELPHGVGIDGVSTANNINELRNGAPLRSNAFKFTVGKYRVRIRSTENFNASIFFAASTTFVVSIKAQLILGGFLYNGI